MVTTLLKIKLQQFAQHIWLFKSESAHSMYGGKKENLRDSRCS